MEIKSMTGYGRTEDVNDSYRVQAEIKSVNSRFLDLNIKLPRKLNFLEGEIRTLVKNYIRRGKADLYISYEDLSGESENVRLDMGLAREYFEAAEKLSVELGLENNVRITNILQMPDVLKTEEREDSEELLRERVLKALEDALTKHSLTRIREGENLKKDLLSKLDILYGIVDRIDERSPEIVKSYQDRLYRKVSELLNETGVDEGRMTQEVTLYADRICTDEERVRLRSHIKAMENKLLNGGEVGRELDFILQEMNREANTTLSKANDIIVSEDAIDLKTIIEKLREQIQNLE